MYRLELKTTTAPVRFACMVLPIQVRSDAELYAHIQRAGSATLYPYIGLGFGLCETPTVLTPSEFETQWQGD